MGCAFEHLLGAWDKGDLVIFEVCCGCIEEGDVLDLVKGEKTTLSIVKDELDCVGCKLFECACVVGFVFDG